MAIKSFEDVIKVTGNFGYMQLMIFTLLCSSNIIFALVNFGQLFMSLTPPHWCSNDAVDMETNLGLNLTEEEFIRWTVPPDPKRKGVSRCKLYDVNTTQILLEEKEIVNTSWPTRNCSKNWKYNYTLHHPTITSELNWVCQNKKLDRAAKIVFHIGCICGGALFGLFADLFGRRNIVLVTNFIGGLFGVLSATSTSFWTFSITRFIVGLTHFAETATLYILMLEYSPVALRTLITNLPVMICFTGGMCAMPMLAYLIHDWRHFGAFIGICQLLHFLTLWILPESARWLIISKKDSDALKTIQWMAKINRKTLADFQISEIKTFVQNHKEEKSRSITSCLIQAKSTLISLSIASIAINVVFEGFTVMAQEISENYYFTFTVMGAVELPAGILTVAIVEWAGRKPALVWALFTSAMGAFLMTSVYKADIMYATIAERFLLTVGVNSHLQFTVESFSTDVRAFTSGIIHSAGLAIGLLVIPIVTLSKSAPWIAYVAFGCVALMGAAVSSKVDETRNKRLVDASKGNFNNDSIPISIEMVAMEEAVDRNH